MGFVHCLRFITTYKCNLFCRFCHKEGIYNRTETELGPEKFSIVLQYMLELGLKKLKLVGGEPLLSRNLESYLDISFRLGVKDVGVTTNGSFPEKTCRLAAKYPETRFSISIPSLEELEYKQITGCGELSTAIRTVVGLASLGLKPTINMVVDDGMKIGTELLLALDGLFRLTNRVKLIVPCESGYNKLADSQSSILYNLCTFLEAQGIKSNRRYLNHFIFDTGSNAELLVTVPYCPMYCKELQRSAPTLRLSPEGFLKPCLLYNDQNILLSFENSGRYEMYQRICDALSRTPNCRYRL